MNRVWKVCWDLLAIGALLYFGIGMFLLSGRHIPFFGYIPIGTVLGAVAGYFAFMAVYAIEGSILWLFSKLFQLNRWQSNEEQLPTYNALAYPDDEYEEDLAIEALERLNKKSQEQRIRSKHNEQKDRR
jgi:hypothetical protein